ncbi:hypothetical protein [Xanthocytophaga agilis]|uniref:hypothetical protein n=1 Tax=Xanthocytophaga agilis TaxID=3048010 RepID=UPI0028D1BD61|nr:hypothetical protein [Xanthocytophaga agilis]
MNIGDVLPNVSGMQNDFLDVGEEKSYAITNENFNHFYFYSNSAYTDLLGCLIIKNTYPTLLGIPEVQVQVSGNFTPAQNEIKIVNSEGNTLCFRGIKLPDWHNWGFDNRNLYPYVFTRLTPCCKPISQACTPSINIAGPSSEQFSHLYFYQPSEGFCSENANETLLRSRIIYRNTDAGKICINKIYIQAE